MITDQDVEKLKETFATKEDLKALATKEALADLRVEVGEISENVRYLVHTVNGIVGAIQDIREDNAVGAAMLARHDRQIHALAAGTGVAIPG
jgi:hypothetical protein